MILYPAIDVLDGKCVRLVQGNFGQVSEYGTPVEIAKFILECGAQKVHLVDLDAARSGIRSNLATIEEISKLCNDWRVSLQVGGGVRNYENARQLIEIGVTSVVMGTAGIRTPQEVEAVANDFAERVLLGLDYRVVEGTSEGATSEFSNGTAHPLSRYRLAIEGWETSTKINLRDVIDRFSKIALGGIIVTDIGRDGLMVGPDVIGIREIAEYCATSVIASGGVSSLEDLAELRQLSSLYRNVSGVIVGKAIYEGKFSIQSALNICN